MNSQANHAERAHALLSASGSSRWINCTASARLEEAFPDEETSTYALEGTLAHEYAELILKADLKIIPLNEYQKAVKVLKTSPHYYEGMYEDVKPYTDYVIEQFKEAKRIDKKAILLLEQKFDLTKYVKDGFGTSDAAIVYGDCIEVIDLKFGKGIQVEAEHNTQLKYYGLGVLETLENPEKIVKVKLTIVQPRLDNISSWNIPSKFLVQWAEEVLRPKAIEAFEGTGEQVAGSWCTFCKVRPNCRALYDHGMAIVKQDFDALLDPRILSDDELLEAYKQADFIKKWLDSVGALILKEALQGKEWKGYKLVEGRSNRTWTNEDKVKEVLEENLFEPEQFLNQKLKGIGDLEKLLGKPKFNELLNPLTVKPAGAPTLVDENDKREAYGTAQAKKDFAEPIEETDFNDLL